LNFHLILFYFFFIIIFVLSFFFLKKKEKNNNNIKKNEMMNVEVNWAEAATPAALSLTHPLSSKERLSTCILFPDFGS